MITETDGGQKTKDQKFIIILNYNKNPNKYLSKY